MNSERQIAKQIAAAQALRDTLKAVIGEDADTLRDTIEGETSLHDAIASVMASIREDEIMTAGLAVMLKDLGQRKNRIEERIGRKRTAIEQAMQIGEIRTIELADATLSIKTTPRAVEVTDEAKIPAKFWKPQDPKLDRAAIKAALKDGESIDGATLDNGGITLQIRRL